MRGEGGLRGYGIGATALKAGGASAALALVSYGSWLLLSNMLASSNLITEALLLGVPAALGLTLYATLVWTMRLPEVELIMSKVIGRLRRETRNAKRET
jgi:hypothetical protein